MTIFGWDSSHYDGHLTRAILQRARDEGIVFWSHKLGQGSTNTDPLAAEAFANAQGLFRVIGGYYWIEHGADMVAEAKRCISLADQVAPYWRGFDGWVWQIDAERDSNGLPTKGEIDTFGSYLQDQTNKFVVAYASAGMYGDTLSGLPFALWNAHYGSNPVGGFKTIYPGDHSAGWDAYSGQTPKLLQYGSNATIAGLTTCDADAFRGTIDDLLALVTGQSGSGDVPPSGGDVALDDADKAWMTKTINDAVATVARQVWGWDPNVAGQAGLGTPAWRSDAATNSTASYAWGVRYLLDMVHQLGLAVGVDMSDLPAVAAAAAPNLTSMVDAIPTDVDTGGDGVTDAEMAAAYRAAADVLDPPAAGQ